MLDTVLAGAGCLACFSAMRVDWRVRTVGLACSLIGIFFLVSLLPPSSLDDFLGTFDPGSGFSTGLRGAVDAGCLGLELAFAADLAGLGLIFRTAFFVE